MSKINAICVYCGSGPGTDPAFVEAARDFGKILAHSGIRLVYGGGSVGLMGAIASRCSSTAARSTGIIPEFLTAKERPRRLAQELIVTRDMHERKRTMFERSDAFVALPGGIGTLEEMVEQMTWAQLGRHKKPILIANIKGFWDPLLRCSTTCASRARAAAVARRRFAGRRARRQTFCRSCMKPARGERSAKANGGAGRAVVMLVRIPGARTSAARSHRNRELV